MKLLMNNKWERMQGTGGGLIWHITLALARWDWQRQLKSSFMIASLKVEIWTWDLHNTEKWHMLDWDILCCC